MSERSSALDTFSLNQDCMPKWRKSAEKTATTIVGVMATRLKSVAMRVWRRAPALPRRRSIQSRTSRDATSAPRPSSSTRSTLSRIRMFCGSGPKGADPLIAT